MKNHCHQQVCAHHSLPLQPWGKGRRCYQKGNKKENLEHDDLISGTNVAKSDLSVMVPQKGLGRGEGGFKRLCLFHCK